MNKNIKRIGFACKWATTNKKGEIVSLDECKTGGTTHAWAKRNNRKTVEQKILDSAKRNIENTHTLIKKVALLPPELRMVRITSDMLTFYTLNEYVDFWQSSDVQNSLSKWFEPLGKTARDKDVRLSFHPDQFVVLASDREEVVNKSIQEFEYHVDMARWMGYGKTFQDIKINVHIGGRQGPEGIRKAFGKLSNEARNTLTIENDEMSWGIDASLKLADLCPLVLDIHHHWVKTGEYIKNDDERIKIIVDSWRGNRPVIHYSVSREEHLFGHNINQLPNLQQLIDSGINKQKLRAHSDYMWNNAVNDWAKTHTEWADVMCELKSKQIGAHKLHEYWKNSN